MAIFKDYLENKSPLILHGALGTEMESLGYDISGKLWSAKYLLEKPEVIQKIHETYVAAGSDLITTSSYQATLPGLIDAGLTEKEAEQIIALTVQLAKAARDKVWATLDDSEKAKRPYPLISGDVGPTQPIWPMVPSILVIMVKLPQRLSRTFIALAFKFS